MQQSVTKPIKQVDVKQQNVTLPQSVLLGYVTLRQSVLLGCVTPLVRGYTLKYYITR